MISFVMQNTNGVYYDVVFDATTGVGKGTKHGLTYKSVPLVSPTVTTVTVDAGSLSAWKGYHRTRMLIAAVYNTTQTLDAILNAAS